MEGVPVVLARTHLSCGFFAPPFCISSLAAAAQCGFERDASVCRLTERQSLQVTPLTHTNTHLWTPASAPDSNWPAAVSHQHSVIRLCIQETKHFNKQYFYWFLVKCLILPYAHFFFLLLHFFPLGNPCFHLVHTGRLPHVCQCCSCARPLSLVAAVTVSSSRTDHLWSVWYSHVRSCRAESRQVLCWDL